MDGVLRRAPSYPRTMSMIGRDFRKEFKGSVLEKKAKKSVRSTVLSNLMKTVVDWTSLLKRSKRERSPSYMEEMPTELLENIFVHLDRRSAATCRGVCRRWKDVIESKAIMKTIFPPKEVSRLTIRGVGALRRSMELRWVEYGTQTSRATQIPNRSPPSLQFAFAQFNIQRIIIQDMSLSDDLVDLLRLHLLACTVCVPVQLSLIGVDFSSASALSLHRLLALVGRTLETIEMQSLYGLREMDVTDAHVAQLDRGLLRRIVVDGVRLSGRGRSLGLTDECLRGFAAVGNFPTLVLDRCAVTTAAVCDYTADWLASAGDGLPNSQVCTIKRCVQVSARDFEEEVSRRGLRCRQRSTPDNTVLYNVHSQHGNDEFTVALLPIPPLKPELPIPN